MSTLRTSARAALLGALTLGGCAPRATAPAAPADAAARPAVRVENQSREQVDVYLVGETREWHLGRLAPGARASLRLPTPSPEDGRGMVRLAIVAGGKLDIQPARDAHAVVTMQQPVATMLGQRWTFAQGQLTGLRPHPGSPR